jgi:hypothetical protein
MVRNQTSYQLPLPVEESPLACRQLDAGVEVLLQAVRRYGTKESRHHFRYWLMSDEWPCGGYWKENPKQFAQYYARLVRTAKAVKVDRRRAGRLFSQLWHHRGTANSRRRSDEAPSPQRISPQACSAMTT